MKATSSPSTATGGRREARWRPSKSIAVTPRRAPKKVPVQRAQRGRRRPARMNDRSGIWWQTAYPIASALPKTEWGGTATKTRTMETDRPTRTSVRRGQRGDVGSGSVRFCSNEESFPGVRAPHRGTGTPQGYRHPAGVQAPTASPNAGRPRGAEAAYYTPTYVKRPACSTPHSART
jgi:hypothetical protein